MGQPGCASIRRSRSPRPWSPTRAAATIETTTTTAPTAETDGPYAVGIRTLTFVDPTRGTPAIGDRSGTADPYARDPHRVPGGRHARPDGRDRLRARPRMAVPNNRLRARVRRRVRVALHALLGAGRLCRHRPDVPPHVRRRARRPDANRCDERAGRRELRARRDAPLPAEDADIQQIIDGNRRHNGRVAGETVALDVEDDRTLRDPRVSAVAALRCIVLSALRRSRRRRPTGTYFEGPPVPLMLIHGTADPTVPYATSSQEFGLAPRPSSS